MDPFLSAMIVSLPVMKTSCDLKSYSKEERKEGKTSQDLKQDCLVEGGESVLGFGSGSAPCLL